MADVKISQLTALASASSDVAADVLAIVDTSVPQTKKITIENLVSPITLDKSNARIGIGESSPGSPLDVKSGEAANTANFNSTSGATNITLESSGSLIGQMEFVSSGTSRLVTRTSASLGFGSNNTTALTLDSSQNATFAGSVTLDADNADLKLKSGGSGDAQIGFWDGSSNKAYFVWDRSDDRMELLTSLDFLIDTDTIILGNVGIGTDSPGYQLDLRRNDTGTTTSLGIRQLGSGDASMTFQTTTSPYGFCIGVDGSDSDAFKIATGTGDVGTNTKMTITSAGRVGINATSPNAKLDVREGTNGQEIIYLDHSVTGSDQTFILFKHDGTSRGHIQVTDSNDQIAYNTTTSDKRLKKDFEDWNESILPAFKSLKPQLFNFIHSENNGGKRRGYIAQDNVDSFPEAYTTSKVVDGDDTEYYSFNPTGMVAYLMKAVQELSAKVEELEGN